MHPSQSNGEKAKSGDNDAPVAGIGVGMTPDYGAAQILYVKRGYIPDGRGLTKDGLPLVYGGQVTIDDSLTLYFLKSL